MDWLTSLLGGGLSALGSLFGAQTNASTAQNIANENIAFQEQFAQNGISWKVADAKRAGINPLAALGAQTNSFSNIVGPDNPGQGVAHAGQDIGRAIQALQSPEDKANAAAKTALDLEGKAIDNDLKKSELASSLAKASQPGTPPGIPTVHQRYLIDGQNIPGGTASGNHASFQLVQPDPFKRTSSDPSYPGSEPGSYPSIGWAQNGDTYTPTSSKNYQEHTSNDTFSNWAMFAANRIAPLAGYRNALPPFPAPIGKHWLALPEGSYRLLDGPLRSKAAIDRGYDQ